MKQREPIADTEPRETQTWQIVWTENGMEHREPVEVVRDQPSGRYAWRAHAQRAGYAWAATPAVAAHRLIEDVCPFAETVECIPREVPSRKSALARARRLLAGAVDDAIDALHAQGDDLMPAAMTDRMHALVERAYQSTEPRRAQTVAGVVTADATDRKHARGDHE